MKYLVLALCAGVAGILLDSHCSAAQTALPVRMSFAEFHGDSSQTLIEMYYGVSSKNLVFVPSGEEDAAAVEFTLTADRGAAAAATERWRFVAARAHGDTADNVYVGVHDFVLAPGEYVFHVLVADTNERAHPDSETIKFNVYDFNVSHLMLSDIELGSSLKYVSPGETSSFVKNGIEMMPDIAHVYADGNLRLAYYTEAYNILSSVRSDSFRVETTIFDMDGDAVYDHTELKPKAANSIVIARTLPIESLTTGKYRLVVRAFTTDSRAAKADSAFSYQDFYVNNSALPPLVDPLNAPDYESSDFAGRSEGNLDTLFQQFSYIASQAEKDEYKLLSGAVPKAKFLYEFWKTRNGFGGAYTLKKYYAALNDVNAEFKTIFKPGWKTDRGRVFLKYGKPTTIDYSGLSSTGAKPYVTWQYDNIEGGVIFVFVDISGFGNFKLVHSTERTEIHDNDWYNHYATNLQSQQGQ